MTISRTLNIMIIRRDTLSHWVEANPVLQENEPALETDTRRLRIGNGVDAFIDLPYYEVKGLK